MTAESGPMVTKDRSISPELSATKEAVSAAEPPQEPLQGSLPSQPRQALGRGDDAQTSRPGHSTQQQAVKVVKDKSGKWIIAPGTRLVNNLSWVVGFMELANAGDFAANVWNDIPVPVYATVFMAVGGTVAGILSIFAFRDAVWACHNVRYLRKQRSLMLEGRRQRAERHEATLDVDVVLDINFRELGIELVTRWIMDLLMGFGAVLICIGTFMAIGGANRAVFLASNLLSGYIGNTPIALFGLANFSWATFIFCKAQSHATKSRIVLGRCTAATLVKRRARRVQVFSVINGTATLVGGVASMITATRWWGYVILIPVILSSIFCNVWWRKMMGYTRSESHPPIERDELVHALEFTAAVQLSFSGDSEAATHWCPELPDSLAEVLRLLSYHSLFDSYCLEVVANPSLRQALSGSSTDDTSDLVLTTIDICTLPSSLHPILMDLAKAVIKNVRLDHFRYRERYFAELLGTYCARVSKRSSGDFHAARRATGDTTEKT